MKVIQHTDTNYASFCRELDRKALPEHSLHEAVAAIVAQVREQGDAALIELTAKFDGVQLTENALFVTEAELAEAESQVPKSVKEAIEASRQNIHSFAQHGMRQDWSAKNAQGVVVGERFTAYDRVGVYVPGGKAPLVSTALMTAAFAQAAGVPEILAATPVGKNGKILPELLYALKVSGATEILKVGGAHAIAAMAIGTKQVRNVEKIFGPGNKFVVEAKRQLVGAVSIDLLPGPSEVLVVADDSANPSFVAADILAQAEHGGDSAVGLVTPSQGLLDAVLVEVEKQKEQLSRKEIISEVLNKGAFAIVAKDMEEAVAICNAYAPEHLSLVVENDSKWLAEVKTAGAIYQGGFSAVAVGDFLAGPSHTLPTGGSGKSFSGIRADQFQRRTSIVSMCPESVKASEPYVSEFARIEGLDAHGASVKIRADFAE